MKHILTILLLLLCLNAGAQTTYYISASGDDANNGTSTSTPWQTLAKVNAKTKVPGDVYRFNKGDIWYGSLIIGQSGNSSNPITISSYGSGANPVITGFTTVSSWTNLGSNIWESTSAVSTLSTCNTVVINGVNTQMGRYPNTGYLTYQSAVSNTSITSSSLNSATTNWAGAEAVIRKNNYATDRCLISNHSGTTLTYTNLGTAENGTANFGFFIQNDVRTLDQQNEWYYNPSTKKIRIYSTTSPTNVQVATVNNLLSSSGFDYITVDGIDFKGSNSTALYFASSSDNCKVQNCSVSFAGSYGIDMNGVNGLINNNVVNDCGSALIFKGGSGGTVTNNTVRNSGIVEGQPYLQSQSDGIYVYDNNSVIQYNNIKNTSCYGIQLSSQCTTTLIDKNLVDSSSLILNDVGGIYCTGPAVRRTISNNIVLNTLGNPNGSPTGLYAEGIYLDEYTTNTTVTGNTVYGCKNSGIKLHYASNNIIRNNTVFNNANYQIYLQNDLGTPTISGNLINSNIFFSKASTQWTLGFVSVTNDISNFGTADSNYYARPINDNTTFSTYQTNTGYVNRTLATWQSFTAQDLNSKKSPKTVTSVDSLRFEYNATQSPVVVSLPKKYIDVAGNVYNGTITLQPYTSAVLIQNGAIAPGLPPTVTTSGDQSIAVSTTNIFSAPVPASGQSITSYLWTKVSGPTVTIVNPTSQNTGLSGLLSGAYKFRIAVTQTDGQTAYAEVNVTVTLPNLPPVVNAGPDQFIVLPQTTLSGSVTPASGTTVTYAWTKVSGNGDITGATTLTPAITNLNGISRWRLQADQSDGQTVTDDVEVTANLPTPSNKWNLKGRYIFKNKPQIN